MPLKQKEIIFTAIPSPRAYKYWKKDGKTKLNQDCEFLAKRYNGKYYDGMILFDEIKEENIYNYFFMYDEHWNQRGSDWFAKGFAPFLTKLQ